MGGVTYNYITQNGQVVRQTWGNHVMDFVYDNSGKPYALKYDGTTYYYVLNLQGDVMSIITHWGESYGSYTYDAWGNVLSVSGDIAYLNPIRYRGYYYDTETRLYYLGSRYYDPQVKRFVNADGYASTGQGFIGQNMFVYCNNSPITMEDSTGRVPRNCLAVSDGAAGACASNYRPAPKANMVKRRQYDKICAAYNILAPAGAENVNITATTGTKYRTKLEHFVDGIPYLAGNLFLSSLIPKEPAQIATAISIVSYALELDSDSSPPSGTYNSVNVVIEYDLADTLTGISTHYKEERSYLVWAAQNNALYMDRFSTTYYYIGG